MSMTKAEQEAEAKARNEANGAPDGNETVSDINDNTGDEGEIGSPRQPAEDVADEDNSGRPKPLQMSPADQVRRDMAKKFRRQNAEDDVPFNGNLSDPEMLYGISGREELEPEPDAPDLLVEKPVIPAPKSEAPKTRTITVRGKAIEMSDDEILAAAQKNLAADSYLDEARDLLQEAKTIKAERAGRAPQHPEGDTRSTQDDGQEAEGRERQHPDDLEEAIEQIQFGDPKEAAAKIRKVMRDVSEKEADEGQMRRLVKNDIARVQVVLKTFSEANPSIANDKIAAQAIEQFVYDVTREEIEKLGDVDASKIPQNPAELANWHRFYRINGRSVSNPEAILENAKGRYLKWKGVSAQPVVPAAKAAPRVVVNVDRDQRRAAIPNQPTRSMAVQPDAPARSTEGRSRSDTIMKMRQQRGQTVA